MRKILALLSTVILSGSLLSIAQAGPTPSVSVSLVCDRGVGASQVSVTFQASFFNTTPLGSATLSCGPDSVSGGRADRQRVPVTGSVGWMHVSSWSITTAGGPGGCFGDSVVPGNLLCQLSGAGPAATLTAR